jgi:hypothetical protein
MHWLLRLNGARRPRPNLAIELKAAKPSGNHRFTHAEALQWMFFEQHSLEPNIGTAYFWLALVKGGRELQQHALDDWMEEGYRALHCAIYTRVSTDQGLEPARPIPACSKVAFAITGTRRKRAKILRPARQTTETTSSVTAISRPTAMVARGS